MRRPSLRRHRLTSVLPAVLALFGAVVAPPRASAQALEELFTADKPVSRDGYKTWSLFLVCNPEWLLPAKADAVTDLYRQFRALGQAIGPDHLAVWFWRGQPRWGRAEIAEDIDVDRAGQYCRAFKLLPSHGPHVLVTAEYPDLARPPRNYEVIELAGSDPLRISAFLGKLADRLTVGDVRSKAPGSESYWVTWFEAIRGALAGVGDRVKVTIDTSFFKIEMSGSAPQ